MNRINVVFTWVARIVLGVFAFYLFCSWVLIPLISPWIIESQGTKILKHPVHVKGVSFNPFLWRLSVKGFEITDAQKQRYVSLDRLSIDVSFLGLFKKIYRVESFQIEGLFVQASLLSEGRINLADLAPAPEVTPKAVVSKEVKQEQLPLIQVDEFHLKNSQIRFNDQTLSPSFKTVIGGIDVLVKGFSTQAESTTQFTVKAKLDEKGVVEVAGQCRPLHQPLDLDFNVTLNQYALTILSPYVGKYTGHELKDGKFDFKAAYRIADQQLTASHNILIQRFEFGNKVQSKDALNLPFGLAIALLEDPNGQIKIALPAKGDMSDPKFSYTHLIWQVVRNFFTKIVTKPFSILASVVGSESGTDDLGYVRFNPGDAQLTQIEKDKLILLVKGLKERPKVLLGINGSYDPSIDWKAIKTTVFNKDFNALQKESTKQDRWVLESLFQRRFGVLELWKLTKSFKTRLGTYKDEDLMKELKRRLVEDGQADKLALEALAQSRAKVVYDFILAQGLDVKNVNLGNPREAQASLGQVPLEFALTVFESPQEEVK